MRLALQAQALAYGDRDLVVSGPAYQSMSVRGGTVTVTFTNIGSGLVSSDGLPLSGFAVAGSDRKFHWAEAKIAGDTVVLRCTAVESPIAVRYAWADNPLSNLANASGLPACPFRTDNWPGVTVDAR
jgi:sialate O-acetylesterase